MTNGESTNLTQLCELISVQCNPSATPDATYLGLEHLASGRMRPIGSGRAADVQSHKFAFQRNDVLYGKLRPYLDKAVLADTDGVCTTELLVFRAKPGIDPRYLACVVHAPDFIEHAMSGVTGAHHPRTSWNHVAQFELPHHGDREQANIARLLWCVNDLLTAGEAAIESAQEFKNSAMQELFTRGLRSEAQKETEIGLVPESWDVVTFERVREWLQYGTSVHCTLQKQRYPVLRIPNVEPGHVNASDLKYCDLSDKEADKYVLQDGDLLFIRTNGVLERLGSCAVYAGQPKKTLFASYLIRARLKPGFNPRYIAYFYASHLGTSLVAGRATPAADGKYNLNTGTIDSLPLPLPATLDEQDEIVTILDALDRKIFLHRQKRVLLEELFQSLLHNLMTGDIRVADLDLSALAQTPETMA